MSVTKELIIYLVVLWRHKWMITACAILSAIVAFGLSLLLTPRYEAVATVRVASAPGGTDDYIYLLSLSRLSNTYIDIALSDINLAQVSNELGMNELPLVEIEPVPDTELIKITAINADPTLARDIANLLANNMVEKSMQLYGGDAPTMREILEDQLTQAKIELDTSVIAYNSAIANAPSDSTSDTGATPIPDTYLESLSRLVGLRHQIYNELLVQYEQARINEQFHSNAITIVEPAILPEKPASPNPPLNAALGVGAGLAVGIVLAFLLEGMDDSLQRVEDVQSLTALPILCKVPVLWRHPALSKGINLTRLKYCSPAPAFDQVCASLNLLDTGRALTLVAITSPEPGSGKTTFAANCALSLAKKDKNVLLIDLDFRRSSKISYLGIANTIGLSNFVNGETELSEILKQTATPHLQAITAGSVANFNNVHLLPEVIRGLYARLSAQYKYIFLDMPDLRFITEPAMLFSLVDSIIMIVTRGKTQRQNLRLALQEIDEHTGKVAGLVFNKAADAPIFDYYSQSTKS